MFSPRNHSIPFSACSNYWTTKSHIFKDCGRRNWYQQLCIPHRNMWIKCTVSLISPPFDISWKSLTFWNSNYYPFRAGQWCKTNLSLRIGFYLKIWMKNSAISPKTTADVQSTFFVHAGNQTQDSKLAKLERRTLFAPRLSLLRPQMFLYKIEKSFSRFCFGQNSWKH